MKTRRCCGGAIAILLAFCSMACGQSDQIFGLKGIPNRGQIQKMTEKEITMRITGGIERSFAVNEILKVSYSDDPAELRSARDRVMAGQLEDALTSLNQIKLTADMRNVIKQDVIFYQGYCKIKLALNGDGEKRDAVEPMKSFVQDYPNSYHFYEANELLGNLAAAMGLHDAAVKFYDTLGEAPWVEHKLRAAVLSAQSYAANDEYEDALSRYQTVVNSSASGEGVQAEKLMAQAGIAVCLAQTGKPEEGLQLAQKIIDENDPKNAPLFARTYNAMGTCYQKLDKPKDALLAYLHTDILFFRDGEAHAEALYHLSKLWSAVRKSDRAVAARTLLLERYPGSPWAKK